MSLVQAAACRMAGTLGRNSWIICRLRPAYESFLDWTSGGQGIPWMINGAQYRIDPRYRHQLGASYDPPVAAFLKERVRAGALCIDVGANVGVYALQFAHWSRPTGRVIAFEPNPQTREVLTKHMILNDLAGRVEVVAAAVGGAVGNAIFYAAGTDGMSRLGEPNVAIQNQVRPLSVPVVTLDDFCEARGLAPDWLFLDIEGFEIQALRGAARLIRSRGEALGIVAEMHPNVWGSANTTRSLAEDTLADLGLRVISLTGQADPLAEHGLVCLAR